MQNPYLTCFKLLLQSSCKPRFAYKETKLRTRETNLFPFPIFEQNEGVDTSPSSKTHLLIRILNVLFQPQKFQNLAFIVFGACRGVECRDGRSGYIDGGQVRVWEPSASHDTVISVNSEKHKQTRRILQTGSLQWIPSPSLSLCLPAL